MSSTTTSSYTYSTTDVEKVARRFRADLKMMAQNTGGVTESKANEYADDVETFAKKGFLEKVDVTLFSGSKEVKAAIYTVNENGSDLTTSAPGGVIWPRVDSPRLVIHIWNTKSYTAEEEAKLKEKLKIGWAPASSDTSHSDLKTVGGRDYMSNGWAMQRKDYSK